MSNRQLIVIIGVTTVLALALAWTIERAQTRAYMAELDAWWKERNAGASGTNAD